MNETGYARIRRATRLLRALINKRFTRYEHVSFMGNVYCDMIEEAVKDIERERLPSSKSNRPTRKGEEKQ